MALGDWIAAVGGAGQEKDIFLDIRREIEEIHYLRYAGALLDVVGRRGRNAAQVRTVVEVDSRLASRRRG